MSPVWTPAQKPPDRTALSCPSHDALIVLRALREAYKKKREDTYQIKTEAGNSKSGGKYYETLYKKRFGTYNATISSVSCDAIHDRNIDDLGIRIKEEPMDYCDPCQGSVKNKCRDSGDVYSQNASRQKRLDLAANTFAEGNASLTTNQALSSSGMHSYVPTSGMHSYVPNSGMHYFVPTSGLHSFAPTSGMHSFAPTSGMRSFAPTSGMHSFVPISGMHSFMPALRSDSYVPTSGSDSCVPASLDLPTSEINAYVPTSGELVTSQMNSTVQASPPLSISDDSDIEPCSLSKGEIKEPQSSCIISSEQFFSASTNLQHNFSENHSSLNLAPGVKHQGNIRVLGHGNQERNRNPLGGSTQTLSGLEEPKARSKKLFSGESQRSAFKTGDMLSLSKHAMRNENSVEKEKLRTGRDCSPVTVTSIRPREIALKRTKKPRSIYNCLSKSTEKGEVQVFDKKAYSIQDKGYVRYHDIEGVISKKQKTNHTQKGFQVPVKKLKACDQLTLHQPYARNLTPVCLPKDLIDILKADDSRRQQVACQISTAKTVALTLVYSDSSTQLSGAATKKTKSLKLHADDEKPVAVILVSMAMEEEKKRNVFVHVPLYSHVSIVDKWIRKLFQDIMSNRSITKVCFGAQKLMHVLLELFTFDPREVCSKWQVDDPKLAAWLLDADHCPHTFTELSETIRIQQASSDSKGRHMVCDDLLHMLEVMLQLKKKLEETCLLQLYEQVEVKVIPILAVMETLGISVDTKLLLQYGKTLQEKIKEVEKEAMDMVGYSFNINSNPQLRQVLFDELKLDEKYKQCKGKALARTAVLQSKSTSESVLLKLKPFHDLPSLVLEYRQLVKVKSTFIDGILEKIENNIQNIPKQVLMNAMKDKSAIEGSVVTINPRGGFKAAVGKMLIAADFQSIELRLLAHLSQDASLLAVFNNPGVTDIFVELTTHWLGIQKENVTAIHRDRTKRIVYSVFYGAGTERLSETLSVTTTQAKELRSSFLAKFPRVKQFTANCIRKCCKQGFVETIFHRRRLLPNIKSANFQDRSFAERQAVNFVVQGSAADICKSAMIGVVSELASRPDLKTQLLVQIHDELLLESPDEEVNTVTEILKSVMESTTHLCSSFTTLMVPIPVSISVGKTWGDMVPWRKYTTTK